MLGGDGMAGKGLRFVIVGAVSSTLYVFCVMLLTDVMGIDPSFAGSMCYLGLLPLNFLLHRRATFRHKGAHLPAGARFLAAHGVLAGLSAATMWFVVVAMGFPSWTGAMAVAIAVPLCSFLIMHAWVFAGHEPAARQP
jgi:putative flippase GtrA